MPLLNVKSKSSTEKDKKIISKTKKSESSYTAVKGIRGGKSLLQRITAVVSALNVYTAKIKDKYEILTDLESIEEYFNDMVKNGEAALDTETSSLDPISCDIAGICLYTPGRKAAYIPLGHISYITLQPVPNQPSKEAVTELFVKYKDNIKWIFHNAKFDIRVMKHKLGVDLNIYWDTQVAAVMLNENEVSKKLKFLYKKYCDPESEESEQYEKLFDGLPFTLIPYSAGYVYAAGDSYKTFALYEFQKQYLNEDHLPGPYYVYRNIEIPCIPVTAWMEDNGISFDMDKNEELHNRYHVIRDEREKVVNDIISEYEDDIVKYIRANAKAKLKYPVNINSPLQLSELIYDVIKLTWKGRKNDERGTGEEILQKLDHPLCKAILEYREVDKLISTYIDKLPTMLNPVTGKIHCSFHQNGTVTGRFSSSDPNAQNIPSKNKEIRQMFCAEYGNVLVGADFSQQEPRILAHLSGDEGMIKAYADGLDLYAWIASSIYSVPYENCKEFFPDGTKNPEGKKRRSSVKAIILGIMYSKGEKAVAEDLGISLNEAKDIFSKLFTAFPKIRKFIDDTQHLAATQGYVMTAWGRKRRLPDMLLYPYEFSYKDSVGSEFDPLDFSGESVAEEEFPEHLRVQYTNLLQSKKDKRSRNATIQNIEANGISVKDNTYIISEASRQCVNSVIQGSAADMIKVSMINIYNDLVLRSHGFKLLLQVHDELIGECPIEHAQLCSNRLSEIMINSAKEKISTPMKCDAEITKCWYGDQVTV